MASFQPAPKPKSALGYPRILAPAAGVRVSPLCLGTMNFGDSWKPSMGECDKDTTFQILDYFYDNGGNFIDTANNYQDEESETWIGEWMKKRGNRDEIVLATKYTTSYRSYKTQQPTASNYGGNSSKSLHLSIEASLKKLQTDYIDLLYLHWWDWTTGVEEVMQSLNHLVQSGKVLYLGVSDTPAWIVSKANQYARDHGLRPFSVYQGRWSAAMRDFERDILPMCEAEGMGLAPWGALGGGSFKTEEEYNKAGGRANAFHTPTERQVAKQLEKVAQRKNTLITSVALAYLLHKAPYVFPIVGGRKVEHLKGNIDALSLKLSQEDIDDIESAYEFDVGFPMNMLFRGYKYSHGQYDARHVILTKPVVRLDIVPKPQPIKPGEQVVKPIE